MRQDGGLVAPSQLEQKGFMMSISLRIALLAGLGVAAMTLPASAASITSGETGARTIKTTTSVELAQRREERDGNFRREDRDGSFRREDRDGNFKKGKKAKKAKKKKMKAS